MSILAIPFEHSKACPQGYIPAECHVCQSGIFVRERTADTPTCDHCRSALIEGEFGRIKGDVLDIISGKGEWQFASPVERQRFLNELRKITFKLISPPTPRATPRQVHEWKEFVCSVPTAADLDAMLDTEEEGVERPDIFEQW